MADSTRTAVQAALALATALTAGHLLFGAHWQWCAMSVMVVSLGTAGRGDLALRGVERGLGALAGALVAAALAAVAEPRGTAAIVMIFVLLGLASGLRQYSCAVYACGIAAGLSELSGYFGESALELLAIRRRELSLGAAIAVAIGWFLLRCAPGTWCAPASAAALAALSALLAARRAEAAVPGASVASTPPPRASGPARAAMACPGRCSACTRTTRRPAPRRHQRGVRPQPASPSTP